MWLCSCVTFTCACVGTTIVAVTIIQKMAKKNFIFHLLRRHRSGPILYRDLSVTGALEKDRYGFEHRFNPSLFGSSHKSHNLIENLDHIGLFYGNPNAT